MIDKETPFCGVSSLFRLLGIFLMPNVKHLRYNRGKTTIIKTAYMEV